MVARQALYDLADLVGGDDEDLAVRDLLHEPVLRLVVGVVEDAAAETERACPEPRRDGPQAQDVDEDARVGQRPIVDES